MIGTVNTPNEQAFDFPAMGNAASVPIAADPKEQWVIDCIDFSYSGPPAGGILTVLADGQAIYKMYIASAGAFRREFHQGLKCGHGKAVTITLTAGGATVSGTLFIQYR